MENRSAILFSVLTALACVCNDVMIKIISCIPIDSSRFERPFTITFFVFLGMLIVWFINRPSIHPKVVIMLLIPSVFQVLSFVLFNYAVVFGQASVCFIIRHSIIMFLPLLTVGKKPRAYQLLAIGLVVLATIFGFFAHQGDLLMPLLVVLSQLAKAGQMTFERRLINEGVELSESTAIPGEAFWSLILSLLVVFPVAAIIPGNDPSSIPGGSLENISVSFSQVFSSLKVFLGILLLVFTSFLSSSSTLLIVSDKNSISFAIVELAVSVLAWAILLIIGEDIGELLCVESIWQVIALLLYGFASLIYHQIIRFPCFRYSDWSHLSDQGRPMEILDMD